MVNPVVRTPRLRRVNAVVAATAATHRCQLVLGSSRLAVTPPATAAWNCVHSLLQGLNFLAGMLMPGKMKHQECSFPRHLRPQLEDSLQEAVEDAGPASCREPTVFLWSQSQSKLLWKEKEERRQPLASDACGRPVCF
mmetsp:Transcript_24100/g.43136  ORF Transcript_24100/g.43136 Transcript_24100/m.43136 type:complete len:138 (+) Transcript_24100:1079-1492(+)